MTDLQEGVSTFLGRDIFGEASANYLLGCALSRKVARGMPFEKYLFATIAPILTPLSAIQARFGKQKIAFYLHHGAKGHF
jgi:hypothetical protein